MRGSRPGRSDRVRMGPGRIAGLVAVAAAIAAQPAVGQAPSASPLLQDAYVFAYPLVTMEMTRRVMTNVARPGGTRAPMGQFVHLRHHPTAQFHDVTAPNADTLYSTAWVDLSNGPYILTIPDAHGRYYLMPMLDAWTNVFASPGKRTTGTGPQTYALVGPGWKGTLPAGVKAIRSPTATVWIIGRTYCTGTADDYKKVHQFQDGLSLVPLGAYGKSYMPPPGRVDGAIDMKTPVREQVNRLDAATYFAIASRALQKNPPARADAPMMAKLAQLGVVPGRPFDPSKLGNDAPNAVRAAQQRIVAEMKTAGDHTDGWTTLRRAGQYGTDYALRAMVAWFGLGANLPEDAVYPTSEAAADGTPYDGSSRYVLHFARGETPPVNAFWSLTMYNADYFFVDNPLGKYTVSPRDALVYNKDGSLDLYLQHDSPGKAKEANWLPAPSGRFVLMLRMYWPKQPVLNGSWTPPPVRKQPTSRASGPGGATPM